jgi:hypothetical protein
MRKLAVAGAVAAALAMSGSAHAQGFGFYVGPAPGTYVYDDDYYDAPTYGYVAPRVHTERRAARPAGSRVDGDRVYPARASARAHLAWHVLSRHGADGTSCSNLGSLTVSVDGEARMQSGQELSCRDVGRPSVLPTTPHRATR